jgi:protein ImuB
MEVVANLAIAANKPTARLIARHCPGVTIVQPGQEAKLLASIPLDSLEMEQNICETLRRWGIETLGGVAALPEIGLTERFGEAGAGLRRLALGQSDEILAVHSEIPRYVIRDEIENAIEQLEPLLFIVSSHLHDLVHKLQSNGDAAGGVELTLELDRRPKFTRRIELPVATRDPLVLLKQLQLSLEANPPGAAICVVQTAVLPTNPRALQRGLFQSAAPEPDKLQTLLARLTALAGKEKVGSPEIVNTHRPDTYILRACAFAPSDPCDSKAAIWRVAFRHFRPPLNVHVVVEAHAPARIRSEVASGSVLRAAGPWRTSGGMWTHVLWNRDEWDVVLEDGGVYRIYRSNDRWFLCGSYD